MSGVSLLPQFELGSFCYTKQRKLCRISILPALESESSIISYDSGFNCEQERSVFNQILNEANAVFDKIIKCVP